MSDTMGERTMTTITNEETDRGGTDSTEFKREDTNEKQMLMKSFLGNARVRTKRQVQSCYMSAET